MAAICAPCLSSLAGPSVAVAATGIAHKFGLRKKTKKRKKRKNIKKKKQNGGSGYETQAEFDEMNQMPDYKELQSKCDSHLSDGFKTLLRKNIPMNELKKYAEESFKIKMDCKENEYACDNCELFLEMTEKLKQLPPPVPDKARSKDIMKKGQKLSEKNKMLLNTTINRLEK